MNIETIKNALGKKRLAKVDHINYWANHPLFGESVEIIMKAPFIDESAETVVAEDRNLGDHPTEKEWLDHIKWRVDHMEYDPEGWNSCGSTPYYIEKE